MELLYLLCNPREHDEHTVPPPNQDISLTLAETCRYMDAHLDEPLTIPVHTWLRHRRMAYAAELSRALSRVFSSRKYNFKIII